MAECLNMNNMPPRVPFATIAPESKGITTAQVNREPFAQPAPLAPPVTSEQVDARPFDEVVPAPVLDPVEVAPEAGEPEGVTLSDPEQTVIVTPEKPAKKAK